MSGVALKPVIDCAFVEPPWPLPWRNEPSRSCPPHHDITKLNYPREVAAWIRKASGQRMCGLG